MKIKREPTLKKVRNLPKINYKHTQRSTFRTPEITPTAFLNTLRKIKAFFVKTSMDTGSVTKMDLRRSNMSTKKSISLKEAKQERQTVLRTMNLTLQTEGGLTKTDQTWKKKGMGRVSPLPIKPTIHILPRNGVRIQAGPADPDSGLVPTSQYTKWPVNRLEDGITLAQWNLRGLSTLKKTDVINSINCDIIALQETGHPNASLLEYIHRTLVTLKKRVENSKGGGSITISDLNITSKTEFHVNKDSNLIRIVLDGVFVIWFGNIYLNRGLSSQIQKLFSVIQTTIPDHERQNLILAGDFNINLNEHNNSKVILLNTLCKQFQLTIYQPEKPTRGQSKLDFLITGSQVNVSLIDHLQTESDHDLIKWKIKFKATTRPKEIIVPNKKLAHEITELSILDNEVTNAFELLQAFLWRRKLKRKQAYIKLKRKPLQNDVYKNILLAIQDEDSIMDEINTYWQHFWKDVEGTRYSSLSKGAFGTLKSICKYHLYEKRDGSVVNQIVLDDGSHISNQTDVSSTLINVLKEIQSSDKFEQYIGTLPFPDLPELDSGQVDMLLSSLASGKAISFDLFSDTILKNEQTVKKLSQILRDLWSRNLNKIDNLTKIFKARLIALNKVHPHIPKKEEFRPIIIMSLIVKIMEARWLPKLEDYMIKHLCPAQTGFVPGQGVFTNIFRTISRIRERTNNKKPAFAFFVDFKSAYNHVRHDLLFKRLEGILEKEEIEFQKALYDKLVIQSCKASFRPNLGVAQGSIISPALFDIYTESLLLEINNLIPLDDIFAYADDILIICENLETLKKCIQIIEDWSNANNLKINKKKSAVLEFIHRKSKKQTLTIDEYFMEYPIVNQYKYLGTWLNQKLTLDTQIQHITKKVNFIRSKLSPSTYHATLDFRKNLWQIFVQPLIEFTLPLYFHEEAATRKAKLEILLRNSFKSFTSLKKTTKTDLVDRLMGYDIKARSEELHAISQKKWDCRKEGRLYERTHVKNKESVSRNLCKNLPKSMIKFINMQTSLCPTCKCKNEIARCSKEHLKNYHGLEIDDNLR